MTALTDKVSNCGMHCNECKSISYKEAREAIEVVKQACIESLLDYWHSGDEVKTQHGAIKAINEVS